jgi:hypothetical protein
MNKIWPYITAFLTGALLVALWVASQALKSVKPIINTDSYIESVDQSVKKLKQSGTNNTQDIKGSIDLTGEPKRKKLLGIFKRKIKNKEL